MAPGPRREVTVVGIYRKRNAPYVRALAESARMSGWTTAWWALDAPDPSLEAYTIGTGAGPRLALLNEVLRRTGGHGWVVVSDDDLVFTRGTVAELLDLSERAAFDLAQPARSDDNSRFEFNVAHPITRARRLSRARCTTFVEIGPLFVVGPSWRHAIIPFPEHRGMGWGLELDWHELAKRGCRLGIVDEVRVAHVGEPGADYDLEAEAEQVHRELAERGYESWSDVQRTLGVWRPWRREPPWKPAGPR